MLQDAGEPGETSRPVAIQATLRQLREDFLPVSQSAQVELAVKCELAMVQGDEARLRNGFFHLLEFLMRICPPHGHLRIFARALTSAVFKVNFSSDSSISTKAKEPSLVHDLDLRVARRTFQAVGGDLVLTGISAEEVTGYVRLLAQTLTRPPRPIWFLG